MSKNRITCLACEHVADVSDGPDPAHSIFVCNECGARMPYGKLAPIIVVEPFVDAETNAWVRLRIQDPKTREDLYTFDLDPQHAAMVSKASLSLVIP